MKNLHCPTLCFAGALASAALCRGSAVAAPSERAAVVYSGYSGGSFSAEYDAHLKKIGLAFDKYENVRLPELTEELGAYRLVIAASLANYANTVKMEPFAAAWRGWLADGGTLIVTDANYESVLDDWVAAFGPGFESGCEFCSAHTKPSDATRAMTVLPDPLLTCPKPLGMLFQKHCGQWSHLTGLGKDWRTPVICADDAPLFAYRRVGKGMVVLSYASSLQNSPIASALLENVVTDYRLREEGIAIESFEPHLLGDNSAERISRLRLKVAPGRGQKVTATLVSRNNRSKGTAETRGTDDATVPENGEVTLSPRCALVRSGTVASRLEVSVDGRTILACEWEERSPEAIALRLKRKHFYPGDGVSPLVSIAPPEEGRDKLSGLAWRIDGGEWREREARDGEWTIPASSLPVGRHVLQARLVYRPDFLSAMDVKKRDLFDWGDSVEAEFFTHPEPKYRMRDDHVLLENGKPFFLLGFYDVAWRAPAEQRLRMVRDVASWGYNTVHVPILAGECKDDGYGAFLDECARFGVRVITEFPGDPEPVIGKYKGKQAVLGWNPGDEPARRGITPERMFERYDRFKQLDPDHLAYTVISVPSQYVRYAAGTDVIAPDLYPVPRHSIGDVYRYSRQAKTESVRVGTALWAVCQAFGGQKYDKSGDWPRSPDAREFRAMSYLALMAGVKGIIYYTYYDNSFDILNEPDLLEAAKTFPAELQGLIPLLLDGKGEMLAEDADGVYAMAWTLGAERRLVAVNTRDKEAKVSLSFAGGQVLYGAPNNLQVEDGRVSFTIPPFERVVIRQDAFP